VISFLGAAGGCTRILGAIRGPCRGKRMKFTTRGGNVGHLPVFRVISITFLPKWGRKKTVNCTQTWKFSNLFLAIWAANWTLPGKSDGFQSNLNCEDGSPEAPGVSRSLKSRRPRRFLKTAIPLVRSPRGGPLIFRTPCPSILVSPGGCLITRLQNVRFQRPQISHFHPGQA